MNKLLAFAVALLSAMAFLEADVAEAKRLGGGGSFGAQRKVAPAAPASPSASPVRTLGVRRRPFPANPRRRQPRPARRAGWVRSRAWRRVLVSRR